MIDEPGDVVVPARDVGARKQALRTRLLRARREQPQLPGAAEALAARVLGLAEVAAARVVAAYAAAGTEPPTGALLDRLARRGTAVLLPLLLDDDDLDWAAYAGAAALRPGRRGVPEPAGATRLGRDAVRTADVVVVPGLAVDPAGMRLGRGGGSYDRVLARLRPGTLTVVLLRDGEVGLDVPVEPHDRPVDVAVTPTRVLRLQP